MLSVLTNPKTSLDLHQSVRQHQHVVTIGNFDGVHKGHQALIQKLRTIAQSQKALATLMLFEPQPLEFFKAEAAPGRIMNLREKILTLFDLGVDRILLCRFNQNFSGLSPEAFIQLLCDRILISSMVVGDDFSFGANRQGGFQTLVDLSASYGFQVENIDTIGFKSDENHHKAVKTRISSSFIRKRLQASAFQECEALLGRPFYFREKVVYGQQLGRQLQVPTANLRARSFTPLLKGVFAGYAGVNTDCHGAKLRAVANLGYRPSVQGVQYKIEVHCLDQNPLTRDLYGQRLTFVPSHKLRDEKAFQNLEQLSQAIQDDIQAAYAYFKST